METEDFGERGVAASPPASTPSAGAPSGASTASPRESNATFYQRHTGDRGKWRTARKEHRCDAYFTTACVGSGVIAAGSRYFDTEDLREWTSGPVYFRVCRACANAEHAR